MAEKNQQDWRLIQKLEQRSAALSAVLPEDRSHLRLFRFRQIRTSQPAEQRQGVTI